MKYFHKENMAHIWNISGLFCFLFFFLNLHEFYFSSTFFPTGGLFECFMHARGEGYEAGQTDI